MQNEVSAENGLLSDDPGEEQHESYFQLVWQRFRKSRPAIAGGLMVLSLIILAIFAEFFAPVDPGDANLQDSFIPPTRIRMIDTEGKFHLRPFVYNLEVTIDPKTFEPLWEEDPEQRYDIQFLVKSWEWKILGLIPTRYHLFGVGEGGKIRLTILADRRTPHGHTLEAMEAAQRAGIHRVYLATRTRPPGEGSLP